MYSIVYVLTDGEKQECYAELVISLCSLRKRQFKGDVFVLMNQDTKELLEKLGRREFEQYRVNPIVVEVPEGYSKRFASRYIKTSMRKWIKGDFLYIDTDTMIADELPDVISEYDIAMVLEHHVACRDMGPSLKNYTNRLHSRCGYDEITNDLFYFNSGVIWAKDTEIVYRMFDGWHQRWSDYSHSRGVLQDQPALNLTNKEMGGVIHQLPGVYNVQVSDSPFPTQYLANAKIIHYKHHSSSTYLLATEKMEEIDIENPRIQKMIDAPKEAFSMGTLLQKDDDREQIMQSIHFRLIDRLYRRHPKIFQCGEKIISVLWKNWERERRGCLHVKKLFHMRSR